MRPASAPPHLCVLRELCVEIPLSIARQSGISRRTRARKTQNKSLQISALRTLPSSVYRKFFVCRSYVNGRVPPNNSHSGTHLPGPPPSAPHNLPVLFVIFLLPYFTIASSSCTDPVGIGDGVFLSSSNSQPPIEDPERLGTFDLLVPLSPLAATFINLPVSVADKRLTVQLSLLDATLTKNTGGLSLTSSSSSRRTPCLCVPFSDSVNSEFSVPSVLIPVPFFDRKQMPFQSVLTVEWGCRYGWKLPTGPAGRVAHAEEEPRLYLQHAQPAPQVLLEVSSHS